MLAKKKTTIHETVEARNVRIAGSQAWELLRGAKEVIVGQGQRVLVLHPATDNRVEILALCLGRTGNLRAPTLKIGNRLLVGFNEAMYQTYLN